MEQPHPSPQPNSSLGHRHHRGSPRRDTLRIHLIRYPHNPGRHHLDNTASHSNRMDSSHFNKHNKTPMDSHSNSLIMDNHLSNNMDSLMAKHHLMFVTLQPFFNHLPACDDAELDRDRITCVVLKLT